MKVIKTAGKILLAIAGVVGVAVLAKQKGGIKPEDFDCGGYDYDNYDDTFDDFYWWNDWMEDGIVY